MNILMILVILDSTQALNYLIPLKTVISEKHVVIRPINNFSAVCGKWKFILDYRSNKSGLYLVGNILRNVNDSWTIEK